jgi:hypothetical protein
MMPTKFLNAVYRYKVLWLILGAVVCSLYGYSWLMSPRINPYPVKKLTIRGVFPFDQDLELRYAQSFYTRNPMCKYTARVFFIVPQAKVSREIRLPMIPVRRTDKNSYEVELFRDTLSPGFCEWTPDFIDFLIFSKGQVVTTAALLGFPKVVNSLEFNCAYPRKYAVAKTILVCLQDGRGARGPKSDEATVNYLWKEGWR